MYKRQGCVWPAATPTATPSVADDLAKQFELLRKENEALRSNVATLTASANYAAATPILEKMVEARKAAGMSPEQIGAFARSMFEYPVNQIETLYNNERVLYANAQPQTGLFGLPPAGTQTPQPAPKWAPQQTTQGQVPFNGIQQDAVNSQILAAAAPAPAGAGGPKSMEELFK